MINNTKSDEYGICTILLTLLGLIVLVPLAGLYGIWAGGFVGMKLWAWFVVPIFGVKALTLYQAAGLATIVGFFTHQHHLGPKPEDNRTTALKVAEFIGILCYPFMVLFVGWIIKTFLM